MPRSRPEWIGKTDNSKPPPRVKARILEAHDRTCAHCKVPFASGDKIEFDHAVALILGGENRERNLRPLHAACHAEKTAADVKVKGKIAAVAKASYGLKPAPYKPMDGRPFQKRESRNGKALHLGLPELPRRVFGKVVER